MSNDEKNKLCLEAVTKASKVTKTDFLMIENTQKEFGLSSASDRLHPRNSISILSSKNSRGKRAGENV